ncbi:hypothetical protein LEMLEM_LOCUS6442 [Lemmus lemmus]
MSTARQRSQNEVWFSKAARRCHQVRHQNACQPALLSTAQFYEQPILPYEI